MHRFTDFRPQLADSQYGPEPSLFDIIERYYSDQHIEWDSQKFEDPWTAALAYIEAWLAVEKAEFDDEWDELNQFLCQMDAEDQAEKIKRHEELASIIQQLDQHAALSGDDSGFQSCRTRLRNLM